MTRIKRKTLEERLKRKANEAEEGKSISLAGMSDDEIIKELKTVSDKSVSSFG